MARAQCHPTAAFKIAEVSVPSGHLHQQDQKPRTDRFANIKCNAGDELGLLLFLQLWFVFAGLVSIYLPAPPIKKVLSPSLRTISPQG